MVGQGVAMLTPFFWKQDMTDRRLVQVFDQVSTLGQAYWIVYPVYRCFTPYTGASPARSAAFATGCLLKSISR
jgi:hypothetical protein